MSKTYSTDFVETELDIGIIMIFLMSIAIEWTEYIGESYKQDFSIK